MPDSLTSIGSGAFCFCDKLESIVIPENVLNIGHSVFLQCKKLQYITIPQSVEYIGYSCFLYTPWYNKQPDGILYFGKCLYEYKGVAREPISVNVNEGTIGISANAFSNCKNLESITIPESVRCIGECSFYNCINLKSVSFLANVTTIDESTFSNCSSLESICLTDSVDTIDDYAFSDCSNLKEVIIGSKINDISYYAFYGCNALKAVQRRLDNIYSKGNVIITAYCNYQRGKYLIESDVIIYDNQETIPIDIRKGRTIKIFSLENIDTIKLIGKVNKIYMTEIIDVEDAFIFE